MQAWRILVVDDDRDMAQAVAEELSTSRWQCDIATNGPAALNACKTAEFDVVVTDLRMDGMDGRELLTHVRRLQPDLPVILLTGEASIPSAVDLVKSGAFNYLTKPCEGSVLRETVGQAIASRAHQRRTKPVGDLPTGCEELVGKSEAMRALRQRIELVGRAESPVLVHGETGTGKELVARAIHACSARRARPFVTVNASAIPETLLESEMFGHARGAFTGATQARRGLFAEADHGTLLLDEIGDMPLGLQSKLLRVLQSGEIRAIGADRPQHVDVRVVAATHRRLPDLVREGRFREDLFYRLNVVTLSVPPLRERLDDVPELSRVFLERARKRAPASPARSIAPELLDVFTDASWPGNVRELESVIERLVVLATREDLTPADFSSHMAESASTERDPGGTDPDIERLIQRHVEGILAKTNGNKAQAAKLLGVDLSTLYRWQKKWRG